MQLLVQMYLCLYASERKSVRSATPTTADPDLLGNFALNVHRWADQRMQSIIAIFKSLDLEAWHSECAVGVFMF